MEFNGREKRRYRLSDAGRLRGSFLLRRWVSRPNADVPLRGVGVSLHIRVSTSFWTHRKTLRLRTSIGDAAFWVPIKLWTYAAQNQPDGDFSDYSDDEIVMLIAYTGDAKALLQALLQAGFMDEDRKIHDWEQHNGYHAVFVARAKTAAAARWMKDKAGKTSWGTRNKVQERKRKEMKEASIAKHKTSNASSMLEASSNGESPNLVPTTEDIYQAYPRHESKLDAFQAIDKAIRKGFGRAFLLERTLAYAKTQPTRSKFTPLPASWFNAQRFNDDPSEWEREDGKTSKPKKPWDARPKAQFGDLYQT